ncbi:hypothetical protein SMMN14_08634 [Sphaerulina musiva]
MLLSAAFLAYVASTLAADQSPPVAFALTQQYRPDTKWRSCNSTGDARANCGFCYGSGDTFLGWNCNCDKFCTGTPNRCYYILDSDPNAFAAVTCQPRPVT